MDQAFFQAFAKAPTAIPAVAWNEALSGLFGTISLACWIFVLAPQIWENYASRSADALSVAFLSIWLLGDITNLAGALLAGLVPTLIAISLWYMVADVALLGQVLYYNYINHGSKRNQNQPSGAPSTNGETTAPAITVAAATPDERAPLLNDTSIDVPGSRRRGSTRRPSRDAGLPALQELREGKAGRTAFKNAAAVIALFIAGAVVWALAYETGAWKPTPPPSESRGDGDGDGAADQSVRDKVALALGYVSAVCYLGARIPQIIKNFRNQSCEGLSLLFFILSLLGNVTYGLQILFHSVDKDYLLTSLPWLIGSLGTVVEDVTIFVQFRLYRKTALTD